MRGAVTVEQGTVAYRETGPADGPAVVFVHGAFVDGPLWRKVTPALDGTLRCVVPDLPLGSHRTPMKPGADLSPPGLAKLIADFVAALELDDVTLIGNDTGGALCQLVVTRHPRADRAARADPLRRLRELPAAGVPIPAGTGARSGRRQPDRELDADPGGRRAPLAFGWLAQAADPGRGARGAGRPDHPRQGDRAATPAPVLRGISKRYTLEAAARLRDFERPDDARLGHRGPLLQARGSPSGSPATSPARGSSGSRIRARSSPRTSRSGWRT